MTTVTWTDNSSNETGFEVQVRTYGVFGSAWSAWTTVAVTEPDQTMIYDWPSTAGRQQYQVRALGMTKHSSWVSSHKFTDPALVPTVLSGVRYGSDPGMLWAAWTPAGAYTKVDVYARQRNPQTGKWGSWMLAGTAAPNDEGLGWYAQPGTYQISLRSYNSFQRNKTIASGDIVVTNGED